MGKRILGLDLGTNSIGWAVMDALSNGQFDLVKRGVHIFPEGVDLDKNKNTQSKAAKRTKFRSARRIKFRRKLRKIETLKVLSEYGYCPILTEDELKAWQSKKVYPTNSAFREWCKTSDPNDKKSGVYENPYYYRWLAATTELDLNDEADCFKLGRAFYHMAQRRGFKSNRLDSTPENESGVVKKDITELSEQMDGRTLGQYFWEDCYRDSKPIRKVHTSRDEHYLAEFEFICAKQGIPEEIQEKLHRAIFFQRPLKSQKGLVANCPFEPKKKRCPDSHPLFEEFRMWQVVNNIKIKTMDDEKLRPLTAVEKQRIIPKFLRTKPRFDFKDIAKELKPKNQKFAYYKARNAGDAHVLFNYRDDQTIAGCPISSRFKNLFGDDYKSTMLDTYCGARETKDGKAKSSDDILHEAWHVLFSFDDDEKVKQFAREKFGLDEAGQTAFAKINTGQGYGALSLKAIRKILPFLEQGLIYSHAVFFANLDQVASIPAEDMDRVKQDIAELVDQHRQHVAKVQFINGLVKEYRGNPRAFEETYDLRIPHGLELPSQLQDEAEEICATVRRLIKSNNDNGEFLPAKRLDERVCDYLRDAFGDVDAASLYHPSKEETYEAAERADDGKLYLGSPQISSIRNPVFMRTMHRLKALTNELIKQGVINEQTQVHVEMARELNDANKRAAIRTWQRNNETARKKYKDAIEEVLKEQGIDREASEDEVVKYQLWIEQKQICPYTGKTISPSDFIGENPKFDIEHTIPRSLCCDNSLQNKTLCEREYNRDVKKNKIPTECANHEEILQRVDLWSKLDEKLTKDIDKLRGTSGMEKEAKDRKIQKRLVLTYERDYCREKYRRFTMTEVTGGFKNSQLVDTRIITKYARLYLKTVFNTVHSVNGAVTDDFRHYWGVEKSRDNHVHHAIDAIVVACITRDQYQALAEAYHRDEITHSHIHIDEPWPHFAADMEALKKQILVSHYAPNHLLKQTKKKLRQKGKPVLKNGNPVYQQGKTARGSLHQETFYGAIKRTDEKSGKEVTKYVVRKALTDLSDSDLKKIVDDRVREIVQASRQGETHIKKAVDKLKKQRATVDEIREAELDAEIVKLESQLNGLYCLPNKNGAPIPIKKVRVYSNTTNPIPLKAQGDLARNRARPHKEHYWVNNGENYCIAIYEGMDGNGNAYRTFRSFSNYAVTNQSKQVGDRSFAKRFDPIIKKGASLEYKYTMQPGTPVLFCDGSSLDDLKSSSPDEIRNRLYFMYGIKGDDGRSKFRFHQEARLDKEQEAPASRVNISSPVAKLWISTSKLDLLVGGVDFKINVLGEIEFAGE